MTTDVTPKRISGPAELLQAVPYLLGFHPRASLVLVGLHGTTLVVTARLDLEDCLPDLIDETVAAMCRGGSVSLIAAVYPDPAEPGPAMPPPQVHLAAVAAAALEVCRAVQRAADTAGCAVDETLLVAGNRWRSLQCRSADCCPPGGRELPTQVSAFAADATFRGVVALPDRAALTRTLAPLPGRARLLADLERAGHDPQAAIRDGHAERRERAVKRLLFATARAAELPRWPGLDDDTAVRLGAGLRRTAVRDAVWLAIDARRLDGRPLWRELGRGLPAPYDAPALFLFGWAAWRAGDGALAGIAAGRAVLSDPAYSAADLLIAALTHGVDPRAVPRLRPPRQVRRLPRSA